MGVGGGSLSCGRVKMLEWEESSLAVGLRCGSGRSPLAVGLRCGRGSLSCIRVKMWEWEGVPLLH